MAHYLKRFLHWTVIFIVFPIVVFCWAALASGVTRDYYAKKIDWPNYTMSLAFLLIVGFFITAAFCFAMYMTPRGQGREDGSKTLSHHVKYACIPVCALFFSVIAEIVIDYRGLPGNYNFKDALVVFGHVLGPMLIYFVSLYFGKRFLDKREANTGAA